MRYEVADLESDSASKYRAVWDLTKLELVRDTTHCIMWYHKDRVMSVVRQMNAYNER